MQGMLRKVAVCGSLAAVLALAVFFVSGYGDSFFIRALPVGNSPFARIISVSEEAHSESPAPYWIQTVQVRFFANGVLGEQITVHTRGLLGADAGQKMRVGETVVLVKNKGFEGGDAYFISDRYHLPALFGIGLFFFAVVVAFGGLRGLSSFLGLISSIAILLVYVVPAILAGQDPLFVSFVGAGLIAVFSLYLGHGFNARTTIALIATLITLGIATLIAVASVHLTTLMGIASEESFYLNIKVATLSLRGLLLAGIIIGMMGVLDDVTIGQSATVYELKQTNPSLGFRELYRRANAVGREHIASLVNTLVLAYAGASLPVFVYLVVQSQFTPWWIVLNQEVVAEEIVRTLVGSMALVLAVPITTSLAAYYYGIKKKVDG